LTHKEYALIVAGGKGVRFGSSLPKQFVELKGKPVLLHTIEAFYRYAADIHVVLVLPAEEIDTWHALAKAHAFDRPIAVKAGGATRFQSVKRGLESIPDDALVAIHDGVRPLVSTDIISASFRNAAVHQGAVAAVPLKESLRMARSMESSPAPATQALDRSRYWIVQTPQTFRAAVIKSAYSSAEDPSLTDDASVAERAGYSVFLFEGSYRNIKITTADDLVMAEALMGAGL
jgi:2-C-methyl-D-erythritol 4-phosphate cytidylyltransferase